MLTVLVPMLLPSVPPCRARLELVKYRNSARARMDLPTSCDAEHNITGGYPKLQSELDIKLE